MNDNRFDALTRAVGGAVTRRTILQGVVSLFGMGLLGVASTRQIAAEPDDCNNRTRTSPDGTTCTQRRTTKGACRWTTAGDTGNRFFCDSNADCAGFGTCADSFSGAPCPGNGSTCRCHGTPEVTCQTDAECAFVQTCTDSYCGGMICQTNGDCAAKFAEGWVCVRGELTTACYAPCP